DESDQRGGHQQRKERSHRGPAQDQRRQTVADRGPVDYRAHLLGITHRLARMGCKTDVHAGWRYSGYVPINISRISQGALWDLATTKSQPSVYVTYELAESYDGPLGSSNKFMARSAQLFVISAPSGAG